MSTFKQEISNKIGYTELVYGRINKKLGLQLSRDNIEIMIATIISETNEKHFQKIGKNIYISNEQRNVRLTINSFTNTIITADRLNRTNKDCLVPDSDELSSSDNAKKKIKNAQQ